MKLAIIFLALSTLAASAQDAPAPPDQSTDHLPHLFIGKTDHTPLTQSEAREADGQIADFVRKCINHVAVVYGAPAEFVTKELNQDLSPKLLLGFDDCMAREFADPENQSNLPPGVSILAIYPGGTSTGSISK